MILTNVDAVFEGWGTPAARPIRRMTVAAGRGADRRRRAGRGRHEAEGRGGGGVRARDGGRAIIARLSDGPAALRGETGTTITREP